MTLVGSLNRLAALARENFGIGDEIAMDCCGQFYCNLYWLIIRQRRYLQLCHISLHPLYGSSTRSRLTITRTGKPGRIVNVGWIFRLRRTICWPV